MLGRPSAAFGVIAGVLLMDSIGGDARAEASPAGGEAATPGVSNGSASAAVARAEARGAVVVAMDDAGGPAALALARSIYRDPVLRPAIDDASAHVLIGEAPGPDATAAVKEVAEVRRSAARADSDPVARRLLASLGAGAGAALVVAVSATGGHPVARVLHVASATYAPLELGATVQRPEGAPAASSSPAVIDWPGAARSLRSLLSPAAREPVRPLASPGAATPPDGPREKDATEPRSAWSSPWFWGSLGVVAALGITVLVFAYASEGDTDTVHLTGRIAP